jgi:hypothetical protein
LKDELATIKKNKGKTTKIDSLRRDFTRQDPTTFNLISSIQVKVFFFVEIKALQDQIFKIR